MIYEVWVADSFDDHYGIEPIKETPDLDKAIDLATEKTNEGYPYVAIKFYP